MDKKALLEAIDGARFVYVQTHAFGKSAAARYIKVTKSEARDQLETSNEHQCYRFNCYHVNNWPKHSLWIHDTDD